MESLNDRKARNQPQWMKRAGSITAITAVLGAGAAACGKSVNLGAVDPAQKITSPTGNAPESGAPTPGAPTGPVAQDPDCGAGQLEHWDFMQPDPTLKKVVDLLFVVDTSASMDPKRSKIADTIPQFIGQLSADTDFRIGVMLGHGGASPYSGKLYSNLSNPLVLDSHKLSVTNIQKYLRDDLIHVEDDRDEANGEAGMYSVMRSFSPDRLAAIQNAGFYRPEAALSVVFVTDENDICFPPEQNGFKLFPDYVASAGGFEKTAFDRYCRKTGQTASNYPDLVYSKLATFKGEAALTLAGIVHVDPTQVPKGAGYEDAIGHGPIELTRKSANGVLIDVMDASFSDGLARLGNVVQATLELKTRFVLDGKQSILGSSMIVEVDGVKVPAQYNFLTRSAEISIKDAGKSRSAVRVLACVSNSIVLD